ncbi:hypothetical protein A4R44_07821 [Amycolatopsis sp. M39]|nr:hypothetical protein A4R44_07821 [Amycolatopsis sp. M39]
MLATRKLVGSDHRRVLSGSEVTWIVAMAVLFQATAAVLFPRQGWLSGRLSTTPPPELLKWAILTATLCIAWFSARSFADTTLAAEGGLMVGPDSEPDTAVPLFLSLFAIDLLILLMGTWAAAASIRALAAARSVTPVTAWNVLALAAATSSVAVQMSDHLASHQSIPWTLVVLAALRGFAHQEDEPHLHQQEFSAEGRTATTLSGQPPVRMPAPISTAQRRSLGRLLVTLGWTCRVLGLFLTFSGALLYRTFFTETAGSLQEIPSWIRLTLLIAILSFGILLFAVSPIVLKRGRQHLHRTIDSFESLDGQRYLLYLRPFSADAAMASSPTEAPGWLTRSPFELPGLTHENFVMRQFQGFGRIIAIGQPGERLPELGAERGYLPIDDWKDTLSSLIHGAHAIIMTASPGEGTVWEFTEVVRVSTPARLLLLVYNETDYYTFRDKVRHANTVRATAADGEFWPPLPDLPNLPPPGRCDKGMPWDFPLTGIFHFTIDQRPQFTRFPSTVPRLRHVGTIRRLVCRELKPVADHVAELLERR